MNKETIAWEVRSQYRGKPLDGSLKVEIAIYWPDRRKHDIDNIKSLIDACTCILWEDDSQITDLHLTKGYDKSKPRIQMEVVPSSPDA
jgi:Holliday junction resolvase RusA-like endonuclease